MVIALAAAAMLLSPAPLPVVLVTVLAIAAPPLALVVVAGWAAWSALARLRGRSTGDAEASTWGLWPQSSGRATVCGLRWAQPLLGLRRWTCAPPAGLPPPGSRSSVATALRAALPTQGEAAAGAVRIASSTGARPPRSSIRWR